MLLAPVALGQKLLWQRDGVVGQYRLWGASGVGDVDGDGWEEVAVAAGPYGDFYSAEIWMLSGRDGSTLRVRPEYQTLWSYLTVRRAGDVNGDGIPDYAFKARDHVSVASVVAVASGVDDSLLWRTPVVPSLSFGAALLGNLDLDADGRPDLVVVDNNSDQATRIFAYDHTGQQLYSVLRPPDLTYLGYNSPDTIAALGDVDGDGADDYAVGAATEFLATAGIVVISGRSGKIILRALTAQFAFAEAIGQYVAQTDDLDGDGVRDILAGSAGIPGVLVLFSGTSGKVIRHWANPQPGAQGFLTGLTAIDLDADGVRDALVGAAGLSGTGFSMGRVLGYSGRDGGLLLDLRGRELLGITVDRIAGPANDPFPLFTTAMPLCCAGTDVGRTLLYRAKPATVTLPGAPPCPGGLPAPAEIGLRDLTLSGGRGVRVHLSSAPPGVNAALFVGLSDTTWDGVPLPLDLTFLDLPGCGLYTSIDALALRTTGTVGLDRGYAAVDLRFDLSMVGTRVYAQWLLFGPGNSWPGGLTRPLSWQMSL